jgi:hypothetical protein
MGWKHGLIMHEHGVLGRIFGFEREDVTGGWRKYSED